MPARKIFDTATEYVSAIQRCAIAVNGDYAAAWISQDGEVADCKSHTMFMGDYSTAFSEGWVRVVAGARCFAFEIGGLYEVSDSQLRAMVEVYEGVSEKGRGGYIGRHDDYSIGGKFADADELANFVNR